MKVENPNIEMIEIVAGGLGDLLLNVAFVGGATTSLYLDSTSSAVRPTKDVDCVFSIMTYVDQQKLERKLEEQGFQHCLEEGAPICRWVYRGIKVDVMPSNAAVLGFDNVWFEEGMKNTIKIELPSGRVVSLFSLPYFLAAKLAAFKDRGKLDFYASSDWEDIVTVIDGREDIRRDILNAPKKAREFLKKELAQFSEIESYYQSMPGHLAHLKAPLERATRVLDILSSIP